jgi:hypothetical protein
MRDSKWDSSTSIVVEKYGDAKANYLVVDAARSKRERERERKSASSA